MAKDYRPDAGAPLVPEAKAPDSGKAYATSEDIAALIEVQRGLAAAMNAERIEELARTRQSRLENERCKAECEKSAQQRTQEAADRLYQGPHKWLVSLPGDRQHIHPVAIRANSPEEAEGRYRQVCGILGTEHPFVLVPAA